MTSYSHTLILHGYGDMELQIYCGHDSRPWLFGVTCRHQSRDH